MQQSGIEPKESLQGEFDYDCEPEIDDDHHSPREDPEGYAQLIQTYALEWSTPALCSEKVHKERKNKKRIRNFIVYLFL